MDKDSLIENVILLFLLLLIIARAIHFPIAVFLVSGQSMYPVLKTGDLVVGEAVYLSGFHVGDIVVWYRTFSYGVIHQVITIRNGIVVTKGVNNIAPDPPVPSSYVKYKIILKIPRTVWIPSILALASWYVFIRRRDIVEAFRSSNIEALNIAVWILTFFILLDMAVIFLSTIYYDSYRVAIRPPSISLKGIELLSNEPILKLTYNVNKTIITGIKSCKIIVGGTPYNCGETSYNKNNVYIGIPQNVLNEIMRKQKYPGIATVYLFIKLNNGNVTGKYNFIVPWKHVSVKVVNNKVEIWNPNYLPVNVSVIIQYYKYSGGIVVFLNETKPINITVPPHSNSYINISRYGDFARIIVSYNSRPGSEKVVQEVLKVEFT
ncbi:MAG: signal peptidase I [Desulfurococcales archaeon]|nr:signal peptidase I [Desulfurococcales archaeon]